MSILEPNYEGFCSKNQQLVMNLEEITELTLDTNGEYLNKIEFWKGKELIDFKEVGKNVAYQEFSKALKAWEERKKDD